MVNDHEVVMQDARSDSDERGFVLRVDTEEETYWFRVLDVPMARKLLSEVSRLRAWIETHDEEKAAYDAATPEERRKVLHKVEDDDPAELLREGADLARKAERENRG